MNKEVIEVRLLDNKFTRLHYPELLKENHIYWEIGAYTYYGKVIVSDGRYAHIVQADMIRDLQGRKCYQVELGLTKSSILNFIKKVVSI